MDIKRKVDKYGAVCDDGDNMDVADHISDARKNGFNIIVMGWGASDPDDDPSFLYHYECSDEVYFTNQLPKGIVSMEVYADPSITCYKKSNFAFAARGRSVDAVAFLCGWWDFSVCVMDWVCVSVCVSVLVWVSVCDASVIDCVKMRSDEARRLGKRLNKPLWAWGRIHVGAYVSRHSL